MSAKAVVVDAVTRDLFGVNLFYASDVQRTIDSVQLYEFGPVTFPAYAEATAGLRSTTDEFYDRLLHDPKFLARFQARVGAINAAEVLTSVASAAPTRSSTNADAVPSVATGRLVAACTPTLTTLRRSHK
jgi:hypothetical protein